MYGPAAFRNRAYAWMAEVADLYPACLIGLPAVALMGIRTHPKICAAQLLASSV
jgi:hypothetical protein